MTETRPPLPHVRVAIIGAGFSGLCMGIKLREAGIEDFVILEKADEIGGTWRENTYPGCACDVPSHLYSFSFEPNPDWSRAFSPQPEIQRYLLHVTEKYGLRPFIRFGAEVTRAEWSEDESRWHVTASDGETLTARYLVSGAGGLHVPSWPDIKGLSDFEGEMFHSAEWNHDYDLRGKHVAVIGTGASAIQFVPEIAPEVGHLTLFQRTAPWIMPKEDPVFSDNTKKTFKHIPILREMLRKLIYARMEFTTFMFTTKPEWVKHGETMARAHIESVIADRELRKKVTPEFPMGCKRVLLSNNYYPALTRDNVDLDTSGIEEVTASGVRTKDGRHVEVDAIILGTGFKPMEMPDGLSILGRDGRSLRDDWSEGPEAYLGITCSGFPNYFIMVGPNTGLGSNSIIFMIEAQARYIMDAIRMMEQSGIASIEVKRDVQTEFNRELVQGLEGTVWTAGCNSWYQTKSGRIAAIWPESTVEYWWRTHSVKPGDYDLRPLPGAMRSAAE